MNLAFSMIIKYVSIKLTHYFHNEPNVNLSQLHINFILILHITLFAEEFKTGNAEDHDLYNDLIHHAQGMTRLEEG